MGRMGHIRVVDASLVQDFRKELKELLEKYHASISFGCSDSSDTYGIYDARIDASFRPLLPSGKRGWSDEYIQLTHGWSVDAYDLKD